MKHRAFDRGHFKRRRERFAAKHPEIAEKYPRGRTLYLDYTHGMTRSDYDALLKVQKGRCAICGRTRDDEPGRRHLAVDHCHATGRVRGLLCGRCNLAVGSAGESVDGAQRQDVAIRAALIVYIVTRCIPTKQAGPLSR